MIHFIRPIAMIVVTATFAATVGAEPIDEPACCQVCTIDHDQQPYRQFCFTEDTTEVPDRIWMISTRCLPSDTCRLDLANPTFQVYRLNDANVPEPSSLAEFESRSDPSRRMTIYVHGNRMEMQANLCRGIELHRRIKRCRDKNPIDWVIWSWPARKEGALLKDFREKAERTDGQGLYLAWFLRRQMESPASISMIGYSFGTRVLTGSLHALAGGRLDGRCLPGVAITGASISAGLIAPAIEADWLCPAGYHGRATKNLQQLVILYSGRDAVLKRYWLINRIRGSVALGYSGPQAFGPRDDSTRLPVRSRDCASALGFKHVEMDYYRDRRANAAAEMASVIHANLSDQ